MKSDSTKRSIGLGLMSLARSFGKPPLIESHESPYTAVIGVPPEYDAVIEKLSKQTGLTESEVVRRALLLMETAVDARLQGQRIGILNQSGDPVTEVTGFNI